MTIAGKTQIRDIVVARAFDAERHRTLDDAVVVILNLPALAVAIVDDSALREKPECWPVLYIKIGSKNIFLKMNGPEPYLLIANSLATEEFTGKNLTTAKEMGAFRKHKVTGAESEIRIEQATVIVTAYHDTTYMGKKVRMNITGPCSVPR